MAMLIPNQALVILLCFFVGSTLQRRDVDPEDVELRCHDHERNYEATVFHLHTPKVAGCSMVTDLSSMIGRDNVYSQETCFNTSTDPGFQRLHDTVVMVRNPRDHVFSQYQFCKAATDPGYHNTVQRNQGLPGQKNYHLAPNFQTWANEWYSEPRWGHFSIYGDYEQCYCPHNLQTTRLACPWSAIICEPTADMEVAQQSLMTATMLGVTEAYHETFCLFHAHLLGTLPDHCHCESLAWNTYNETKDTHGEDYAERITIEDEPAEVIARVDAMTKQDKIIYQMGVKRFIDDVRKMERRFATKILCPDRLAMLHQKANY